MSDEEIKFSLPIPYGYEDKVIAAAARRLIEQADLVQALRERVDSAIDDRLAGLMDKAFAEIVQPTDALGKPNAPPISMLDLMVEKAQGYLDEKVDKNGNTVDACGYGEKTTRARWLAHQAAREVWDRDLLGEVKKTITDLRKDLYDKAIHEYAKRLKEIFDKAAGVAS